MIVSNLIRKDDCQSGLTIIAISKAVVYEYLLDYFWRVYVLLSIFNGGFGGMFL